ncbi:MAG: EamA family transporter [Candidatus Methanospirareceae archaeon]
MQWVALAFLASILGAVVVLVDKFVLTHHIKDAFSYQIFLTLTQIPPVLALFALASPHFQVQNYGSFYLTTLAVGVVLGLVFVLYNKALLVEEVSRVIPLFYLSPLFVLFFSSVFLGESLSLRRYFGVGLLVFSAASVSFKFKSLPKSNSNPFSFSPALLMILFLDLIIAGKDVLAKFLFSYIDFWSYLFWLMLGNFLGRPLFLLLPGTRRRFVANMKSLPAGIILLCFLNCSLACVSYVLYFKAISLTFVSLVSAILSVQPFLVFVFALLLGVFYPGLLNESVEWRGVVVKGIAGVTILIGTYLIIS